MDGEYIGDDVPRWVKDGVTVRVKSTPILRKFGISTSGGLHKHDSKAWPGDVGTIVADQGNGWWEWRVRFERGRECVLTTERLAEVVRVTNGGK